LIALFGTLALVVRFAATPWNSGPSFLVTSIRSAGKHESVPSS
jgi:hypothetical protein